MDETSATLLGRFAYQVIPAQQIKYNFMAIYWQQYTLGENNLVSII